MCKSDYDQSVDIWSAGCILGELLLNFVENNEKTSKTDRLSAKYLFPGDSCYPLSPCHQPKQNLDGDGIAEQLNLSQDDQLIKILELLEAPTAEQIESITNAN